MYSYITVRMPLTLKIGLHDSCLSFHSLYIIPSSESWVLLSYLLHPPPPQNIIPYRNKDWNFPKYILLNKFVLSTPFNTFIIKIVLLSFAHATWIWFFQLRFSVISKPKNFTLSEYIYIFPSFPEKPLIPARH
jgi:hypothetical protein